MQDSGLVRAQVSAIVENHYFLFELEAYYLLMTSILMITAAAKSDPESRFKARGICS